MGLPCACCCLAARSSGVQAHAFTHCLACPAPPPLPAPQVYVVHHTDCGMVTFTTPQLRQIVKEQLGADDTTHYHEFR